MPLRKRKDIWQNGKIQYISVEAIAPNPDQPRQCFEQEDLLSLSKSIAEVGILQPLSVRKTEVGWQLVAGERRLRAAVLAGLTQVPCLVVQVDEQASCVLALIENIQRKNLDFWEQACAISDLMTAYGLSQEEVAKRLGKSQSAVANKLRLLKLPDWVLKALRDDGFTERHARALLRLETKEQLARAVNILSARRFTVAQTEEMVEQILFPPPEPPKPTFVLKDVRLFLNSLSRNMDMMRAAGIAADLKREDRQDAIYLTIQIPNQGNVSRETLETV